MNTLTRNQARDLIDAALAEGLSAILDLQQHWIGHRDYVTCALPDCDDADAQCVAYMLNEYVDESAFNGDDERSNGPKDSDDTGLTAP